MWLFNLPGPANPCYLPTREIFSPVSLYMGRVTLTHLTCLHCNILNLRKKGFFSPPGIFLSRYPVNISLDKNPSNFQKTSLKKLHVLHSWNVSKSGQRGRAALSGASGRWVAQIPSRASLDKTEPSFLNRKTSDLTRPFLRPFPALELSYTGIK